MTNEEIDLLVLYPADRIKASCEKYINDNDIDGLVKMIRAVQKDGYFSGVRTVQQELIKLFDLKHLLGTN